MVTPTLRIGFVINVRNSAKYISKCLDSILSQSDENWFCIVTDDNSDDGTAEIVSRYASAHPEKIRANFNRDRAWKMKNFVTALDFFHPSDIVVELDGDDYLCEQNFVFHIRRLHQKYDVVWTQHTVDTGNCPDWHSRQSTDLPEKWSRNHPPRERIWTHKYYPGHLRSFKKFYFDHIDRQHLQHMGEWLKVTSDVAYYTPILEMAKPYKRYFYDHVCCVYCITDNNDTLFENHFQQMSNLDRSYLQSEIGLYLKNLPAYSQMPLRHWILVVKQFDTKDIKKFQEYRARFPFDHFHLFFLDGVLMNYVNSALYAHGLHLYNLPNLVKNSLSGMRYLFADIAITFKVAQYLHAYCCQYVLSQFEGDEVIFFPNGLADESVVSLSVDTNLNKAISELHRRNIECFKSGCEPIGLNSVKHENENE